MLLRTIFSEVCGTDVHLWHGRLERRAVPDHPWTRVGRDVAKMRGPITLADGHPAREGDRLVFFDVHRTCGRCYACAVSGTPTKCAGAQGLRHHRRGRRRPASAAGARRSTSSPGSWRRVLPAGVSAEDYIGGGCGLITAVHAIDRAALRLGDRVLVQGTRRRRPQHRRAGTAVRRVHRHRDRGRRPIVSSWRGGWAPT